MKTIIISITIILYGLISQSYKSLLLFFDDENGRFTTYAEDLRFPVSAIRLPGSTPPSATLYLGGEVLSFPTNADAIIYFEVQMPHSAYFEDSIWVHLHSLFSEDGTADDSVRWVFTYTWANINDQFSAPTTVNTTVDVSTYQDSTHIMDGIARIDASNKSLSSMLICSLKRDVSEDNYAGAVCLMEIDIHYSNKDYY